jgi:hypothetical protein
VHSAPALSRTRRTFSTWAILALVLSASVFCPVFTMLGPLFALRGLAEIKAQPRLRGRRLALAAMVIGVLATVGWTAGAILWNKHARRPMLAGPEPALRAGLAGEVESFQSAFAGQQSTASSKEAGAFLDELTRRYGALDGCEIDTAGKGSMPAGGQGRIPYVLHFRSGDVKAEALFITFGGRMLKPVFKWNWIRVIDPQRGDLVYPLEERERAKPPAPPPPPPPPDTAPASQP